MKISIFALFVLLASFISPALAQNVAGEWYGVGKVKKAGDHNSYLSEMILKQKGNRVTGSFNYFYRSAEIKTKVTGKYDARFKVLELNARPILNYLAKNANGADCPMEGSFTLKVTKDGATLMGQFNPIYEYRITCPAIDVKFTKSVPKAAEKTPIEPDDEDTADISVETKKPIAIAKTDTVGKTVTSDKTVTFTKIDSAKRPSIVATSDTSKKAAGIIKAPAIKTITPEQEMAMALKIRAFDVSQIIDVDADSLKVSLYDNGEVDNDTISLFYNRQLVATGQLLSDKALTFTLALNDTINEIAMFAENLGRIPPNTALAIIYAGEQRFELNLTSTFNKNAAIRFRKKAKVADPKNVN